METVDPTINIYQVFTRLFCSAGKQVVNGSLGENGCTKFSDFTPRALHAIKDLGVSHIWYTGLLEHASTTDYSEWGISGNQACLIKGRAGSPYAIRDYFDVCPDFAEEVPNRMQEFEALLERSHEAGLQVIIDFVPNHVAREYGSDKVPAGLTDLGAGDRSELAFDPNNTFYYLPDTPFELPDGVENTSGYVENPAKVAGNGSFVAKPALTDWYDTIKLNYGVDAADGGVTHFDPIPDTWIKMKEILLYWAEKGVDGFRCDMAEMVPVEFWGWAIQEVKRSYPAVTFIAEVYDPQQYLRFIEEGRFDYLYDKCGLYDVVRGAMDGSGSASLITSCWIRSEGMGNKMLRFLENHDEQRIASDAFAGCAQAGIPGMLVSVLMNTGASLIYFGQELGEDAGEAEGFSGLDGRTTIFDYWSITRYQRWVNGGRFDEAGLMPGEQSLRHFYQTLLQSKLSEPALRDGGFYDLMYANSHLNGDTVYAFARHKDDSVFLVVCNFDRDAAQDVQLIIPEHFFQHIGHALSSSYSAVDLLGGKFSTRINARSAGGQGIRISLHPLSGCMVKMYTE